MSETEWGILILGGVAVLLFMGTRRGPTQQYVPIAPPPQVTTNNSMAQGAQVVANALGLGGGGGMGNMFGNMFGSATDQPYYDGGY